MGCAPRWSSGKRERGSLQVMAPGETRDYTMTISVYEGPDPIDGLVNSIRAMGAAG